MPEALQRQWSILRAIPHAPGKIDAETLVAQLNADGQRVDRRTVQRDLRDLSRVFPLHSDTDSTPQSWYWSTDAPAIDVSTMDGPAALRLRLLELWIEPWVPPGLSAALAPEFARARAVLESYRKGSEHSGLEVLRVMAPAMVLQAPQIDASAARAVYQALLDAKRVQITYAAQAPEGEADSHDNVNHDAVNPLALIVSGRVIHLVCTFAESAEIRQLALHRIKSAEILAVKAEYPAQADLERYVAQGSAQTQRRPMIDLKVRFERSAAAPLYDTPLSADQRIEDTGAGQVIVTATVADTAELRCWLLGFGPLAEVLKPEALRQHMERSQRMAAQQYLHRS